jgi:tripartite-type tricarboxylate transporter receptor subunit TctC
MALLDRRQMASSLAALVGATVTEVGSLRGQEHYPSKPVRMILPYGAGGSTDIVARAVGERLREALKVPFVIDNKPGAFGIVGTEEMARSKPDGYTIMLANVSTCAIAPALFKDKYTIDFEKSIIPIVRIGEIPTLLFATTKNFEPKTVAEIIAYAKKTPGKIRYASVGIGSYTHFDMEIFSRAAGIEMTHIPFKTGAAAALADMVNGDCQVAFLNLATAGAMTRAGHLRIVAAVAEKRLDDLPDVPTLAESGFADVGTMNWLALFAPAGTPAPILQTLHKAVLDAANAPATQELFKRSFTRTWTTNSPEEARAWHAAELARWRRITSEIKIELQ